MHYLNLSKITYKCITYRSILFVHRTISDTLNTQNVLHDIYLSAIDSSLIVS